MDISMKQCVHTWLMSPGVRHQIYHLRFLLLLLYCSKETLLLLFFGWLRGVEYYSIWASPENKTKCAEHDVPTKNVLLTGCDNSFQSHHVM